MCCFGNRVWNGRPTCLGHGQSGGTQFNMRVALMNLLIKSFAYQCWSVMCQSRSMYCFGNKENTNQMTALAMVMGRVKGGYEGSS